MAADQVSRPVARFPKSEMDLRCKANLTPCQTFFTVGLVRDRRRPVSSYEKNAWVSLIAVVALGIWYSVAVGGDGDPSDLAGIVAEMVTVVVAIVVIELIAEIVLMATSRCRDKDERDAAIEGRANIYGLFALAAAVAWVIIQLVVDGLVVEEVETVSRASVVNALIAALVIAEIITQGTQVVLYRRTA